MKPLAIFTCFVLFSFSGLNAKVRTQKVIINTAPQNTIYIDDEEAEMVKGKYLLPRDQKTHRIIVKRDGYLDASIAAVPYLTNGYGYEPEFTVGMDMLKLPEKLSDAKNLRIDAVAIDLKNKNNKVRIFQNYYRYLKKADKIEAKEREEEKDIDYDNSIFSYKLNEFLKEVGFIDTTDKVLRNGYLNNLITNVKITEYTYNRAPAHSFNDYGGMIYSSLKAEWTLTDIYDEEIFKYETTVTSDYLGYEENENIQSTVKEAITNALTKGLIEFMQTPEVTKALKDNSLIQKEAEFTPIVLKAGSQHVSSLGDAVKSSVTIKSEDSHGSGFVVSSEGHIITNYHVISSTEELKVVMNDQEEYDLEVVRVSKIHDLALLKISKENTMPFKINNSKNIDIATDIYAVGSPHAEDLSQSVSKGIISGKRQTDQGFYLMQIDASINSGNSGGAIVNKSGKVLGVVSAKLFGFGIEGIGFGIPAYEILDRLKLEIN